MLMFPICRVIHEGHHELAGTFSAITAKHSVDVFGFWKWRLFEVFVPREVVLDGGTGAPQARAPLTPLCSFSEGALPEAVHVGRAGMEAGEDEKQIVSFHPPSFGISFCFFLLRPLCSLFRKWGVLHSCFLCNLPNL